MPNQPKYKPVTATGSQPERKCPPSLVVSFAEENYLGTGASAAVVKAFDRDLNREVAYKELFSELSDRLESREFFIYESQITAQLDHPNIVPVYEFGRRRRGDTTESDALYLTMKRIQGASLLELVEKRAGKPFEEEELFSFLQVILKVCDAIGFAHSRGVFHRDLKPANIMVGGYGEVYVVDWGLAMIEDPAAHSGIVHRFCSSVVGTPAYMPPEQANGRLEEMDARSDIYSIGACLYEVLTGQPPHWFGESKVDEAMESARAGTVRPPQEVVDHALPIQLCKIALKAMAPRREDRYQTVADLREDLEHFLRTYSFFPRVSFAAGEMMIREGEMGDSAFIIIDGSCEVFKQSGGKEVHLRELSRGDVLGEIAVFANQVRTASVRALTPVTAIQVTRDQIVKDGEYGYWVSLFTKALAERFMEKEQQIEHLERKLERLSARVSNVPD